METKRAFTAFMLSLAILLGYQYLFMPTTQQDPGLAEQQTVEPAGTSASQPIAVNNAVNPVAVPAITTASPSPVIPSQLQPVGRDILIETNLYKAVINENGAGVKSFQLKNYKEDSSPDALPKELIFTESATDLPLQFSWGNGLPAEPVLYSADRLTVLPGLDGEALQISGNAGAGIKFDRIMSFNEDSYQIDLQIIVKNTTTQALQGAPYIKTTNRPFSKGSAKDRYLFTGPAVFLDNSLQEIKVSDLKDDGPQNLQGNLEWVAYEDTYFLCAIIPEDPEQKLNLSVTGEDTVSSILSGKQIIIPPGGEHTFAYSVYMGPKKLSTLKTVGADLDAVINFGWFDIIAKPALFLLNYFYGYFHNYGVAIILVTVLFKMLFWPISHKGMKSMKSMQKIQPKMAKVREKYKDDKERLNQEMINLYKTYKINPLGGCLPMVLQIPVFFALYKVLLQTIELRHAPFMLWITDLSAPDRLAIGFDLPFLGGIPVLTLLMGGSMFLQQKMTPTPADPAQAKIMLFLPVIFTFMFLNFASGLVLYWFINNLLSIGQQYFINKSTT